MEDRSVAFVRGLRAAGVRTSTAEALDALRALRAAGIDDRDRVRLALRAALVKSNADFEAFETLFPLYFGGEPPLENALDDLDPDDEQAVREALEGLSDRLRQLLEQLMSGHGPSREQLEAMARRAAETGASPSQTRYLTQRMLREMGFGDIERLLAELQAQLEARGLSDETIDDLLGVARRNSERVADEVARQIGLAIARRRAEAPRSDDGGVDGRLMDKSLQSLSPHEAAQLRREVTRLVARLRSRAALRQRRGRTGRLDARRTIRASLRYGGTPVELRWRKRRLKPSLVLICDVSTSMRPVAEFMLRLIYELSDQVARARSFAFNADLEEISVAMGAQRAGDAVAEVLYAIPPGYYATDLGRSLRTFHHRHLDAIDRRTTLIVLGDGRNNHNNPRTELLAALKRRSRRLVWLNPEAPGQWGTDDSDMLAYAPVCDAVYPVRNLRQLSAAVDRLLTDT